jgi:hypothetical protein
VVEEHYHSYREKYRNEKMNVTSKSGKKREK